ncbi:Bromodomain-containing protein [Trametes versicolor FP-101664 SS1]|uniref:Bromodomain-containing protein n=1 Tax=Trametes versicolor (strain FP-101664) TaxID=717944 RepID=UPI00046243D0|nr:Bromodomain-containing protein [Trametes versicolor FP-101664 SS1]EIW64161.1 Bromodomain-containing protein [Trametes versicolor FP-101664 SS1]
MSKREALSIGGAGVDIEAPRAKRRKEAPATTSTSTNGKAAAADAQVQGNNEGGSKQAEDRDEVMRKGMLLWTAMKDAVSEGVHISQAFMRLPSKRQYPEYYHIIKHPVALDDIKSKLEKKEYASMVDVKADFERCFRNAKRFNMKSSQIWADARYLHKYLEKQYARVTGIKVDSSDGEKEDVSEKKALHRSLKATLQTIVDMTSDSGRVLSTEFMQLPSPADWPDYYKLIKKPLSLDKIFKKIKRRAYENSMEFADDVELVFQNALQFNADGSPIYDDARTLRDAFRKLMADLPEQFAAPAYVNAGDHPTKIKLKMPSAPTQPVEAPAPALPSSNTITVSRGRAHGRQRNTKEATNASPSGPSHLPLVSDRAAAVTPALPMMPGPKLAPAQASSSGAVVPSPSKPSTAAQARAIPRGGTAQGLSSTYYPNAVYQQPIAPRPISVSSSSAPQAISVASSSGSAQAISVSSKSPSPFPIPISPPPGARFVLRPASVSVPAAQYVHTLRHAIITTMPLRRRLVLHHEDGTRTWTMRLNGSETGIVLSNVTLLYLLEDGSSGDDEQDGEEGTSLAKGKKRGRPARKRGKASEAAKKAKGKEPESSEGGMQAKLNGAVVAGKESGEWEVPLPVGISVLELGEKGGMMWKVYLDRAAC